MKGRLNIPKAIQITFSFLGKYVSSTETGNDNGKSVKTCFKKTHQIKRSCSKVS